MNEQIENINDNELNDSVENIDDNELDLENQKTENIDTSNIFDDFEVSDEIKKELAETEKKGFIYYISKTGQIFKYINFVFIVVLMLSFFYISIEQSDKKDGFADNKDYLDPICSILSGNDSLLYANYWGKHCSSITLINSEMQEKIDEKKKETFIKTVDLLKNAYKKANINFSPEVLFIIDKYNNKMDVEKIISDFDKLKNKFSGVLASRMTCNKFNIKDDTINITCQIYSRAWEPYVPGENIDDSSKKMQGTSVSYAASFVNFLEKDGTFYVLDKQKVFTAEPYFLNGFDYKTTLKLNLKYSKSIANNNL